MKIANQASIADLQQMQEVSKKPGKQQSRSKERKAPGYWNGWCWTCGRHFHNRGAMTAWEKHSKETGHHRLELLRRAMTADRKSIPGSQELGDK